MDVGGALGVDNSALLLYNLCRPPGRVNAENILVILLCRGLSQSLRGPDEPVTCVLCNIIFHSLLQRVFWTVVRAKMAETATAVEILRKPSFAPRNYCDTLFRADPSADATASASVEM